MTQNPPNPYEPQPNPYGPQPNPYEPQSGYPTGGQPGYPPPPPGYGYAPVGPPAVYPRAPDGTPISPWGPCAEWSERFFALLWDLLYAWPAYVALVLSLIAFTVGSFAVMDSNGAGEPLLIIAGVLYVVGLGLSLWRSIVNLYLNQGRTGQSWGKAKRNLRLVREIDGQPAGGLICFVRYLLGGVINQVVLLDILWPLWDPKRQRLSDKILGLIVITGTADSPQPR